MMTMTQCAQLAGVDADVARAATPTPEHRALYRSYLLNLRLGDAAVERLIRRDLHGWVDLGAHAKAAGALVALRWFWTDFPQVAPCVGERRAPPALRAACGAA